MTAIAPEITFDEEKFRELLLYVSARLAGDPSNGSVKSNKVLFFSDFIHYAVTGTPITGVEYVHRRLGPAPRGRVRIQQALIDANEADEVIVMNGVRAQRMLFPKREPDLARFSGSEISVVEKVLELLRGKTGEDASNLSHTLLAWQLTDEGETIPYTWTLMYDGPVPEETFSYAEKLSTEIRERHGVGAP